MASCEHLKGLIGWKSHTMLDCYAKFATEHLAVAATWIEKNRQVTVISLSRFSHGELENKKPRIAAGL